jgi:protein KRI1
VVLTVQIGDMPTRFKYTKSAPVNFGLTPVEILLATDAELNALAGVRHIAPYRRGGLGKTGQGLSKRIRELKGQLRARRWGEEQAIAKKEHKERQAGSGSNLGEMGKKRKWGGDVAQPSGEQGEDAETDKSNAAASRVNAQAGPKKRLGKKQRMRAKLAEEAAAAAPPSAGGNTGVSQSTAPQAQNQTPASMKSVPAVDATQDGERGDGESKKKRRKKKKSGTGEAEA